MLTVYGIPSCGTVKKALAWLDARGAAHRFVDLRATPPTRAQVDTWVAAFGALPMRNTSGGAFRALGPEKEGWDAGAWAAAFAADPMLVRRPVIERDTQPVMCGFRGTDAEIAAALGLG